MSRKFAQITVDLVCLVYDQVGRGAPFEYLFRAFISRFTHAEHDELEFLRPMDFNNFHV